MRATVLILTYRRPDDLRRCLAGLGASTRRPDEILVVHRPDDQLSAGVVVEFPDVRALHVEQPGVVAAINRGLDGASGDFIALIDDDAIPYPDWLERIERWYLAHPEVGGVGGRDIVHQGGRILSEATADKVGMIAWFGRMTGDHHVGRGTGRPVHVLKGVNMSVRATALAGLRSDTRLRGTGAQVHWEVCLCSALRAKGWTLVYDPAILVDHFPAARHDEDARTGFSALAQSNTAHNEQLALMDTLPWWGLPPFLLWSFIVGTAVVPGAAQVPRLLACGDRHAFTRLAASWQGRAAGLRTWRRSRSRAR